jgi:3-deoxy-manno-octulosonate cytidylyltransferase (CMP-KDO synthetase)
MKAVAIIPARFASSRLPGKALLEIAGKPMIEHVYFRASASASLAEVWVATDDERIRDAVLAFGGRVRMTRVEHASGTDRIAEVAGGLDAEIVVNVQGDEPMLHPEDIDRLVAPLAQRPDLVMTTAAVPIQNPADVMDPNAVKVVRDREGFALYFSRLPIPYQRETSGAPAPGAHLKHLGLYAYRRAFLLRYASLPPTPLEQSERLEQLRVLEHGYRIFCVLSERDAVGVDTPADLELARRLLALQEQPRC